MKIKIDALESQLAKETAPRLAVVVGNEDFLKQEAVQLLLEKIHGGPPPEEDCSRLSSSRPSSDDLTQIFDDLRTSSLFGGDRSIVIDNANKYLEVDRDAWLGLLENGFSGASLILVIDDLDGRTKLAKTLSKLGWMITVEKPFHRPPPWSPGAPPWDNPMNKWIVNRARRLQRKIDPKAAHLLQTRVGTSLGDLASALERIATVLDTHGTMTLEVIERHTPDGEESNLFELVDVFFLGDRRRTLNMVKELLHRGSVDRNGARVTEPSALLLQFIGASLRRARQIREAHRVLSRGGQEAELMAAAGVSRPFLPQLKSQARATSSRKLPQIITEFSYADSSLKTGRGPRADELLERLAVAIR